jgi:ABC-2 type transport system permease protein
MPYEGLQGARPALTEVRRAAAFEWRLAWQSRRRRVSLLLGFLPVFLTLLAIGLKVPGIVPVRGVDAITAVLASLYLVLLVVILPLLYGTQLVAQEAEARTLVFLLVRPLSRGSLLLGKFLGSWAACSVQLVVSLALTTLLWLGSDRFQDAAPALARLPLFAATMVLGALAYGALFTLVGLVFSRPALVGLFLALGWENAIPFLPGWIKTLTIRHHLAAFLPATALPPGMHAALAPPSWPVALAWLVGGTAAALLISMWLFARRDYP